eukprot:8139274-Pyramimonas_sp.AAC.2
MRMPTVRSSPTSNLNPSSIACSSSARNPPPDTRLPRFQERQLQHSSTQEQIKELRMAVRKASMLAKRSEEKAVKLALAEGIMGISGGTSDTIPKLSLSELHRLKEVQGAPPP